VRTPDSASEPKGKKRRIIPAANEPDFPDADKGCSSSGYDRPWGIDDEESEGTSSVLGDDGPCSDTEIDAPVADWSWNIADAISFKKENGISDREVEFITGINRKRIAR
jgi:hypothetical protein